MGERLINNEVTGNGNFMTEFHILMHLIEDVLFEPANNILLSVLLRKWPMPIFGFLRRQVIINYVFYDFMGHVGPLFEPFWNVGQNLMLIHFPVFNLTGLLLILFKLSNYISRLTINTKQNIVLWNTEKEKLEEKRAKVRIFQTRAERINKIILYSEMGTLISSLPPHNAWKSNFRNGF